MQVVIQGMLVGIVATIGLDVWAAIAKHLLHLPAANWAFVGRWFAHMRRGKFRHDSIADATAVDRELAIGWAAHYTVGMVYGIAYMSIVHFLFATEPALPTAVAFGLATLAAPWLVMQPGMGAGYFSSKTPRPGLVRTVNLSMHLMFGVCLYGAWLLIGPASS